MDNNIIDFDSDPFCGVYYINDKDDSEYLSFYINLLKAFSQKLTKEDEELFANWNKARNEKDFDCNH